MAKIIFKCPYLKSANAHAKSYVRYMATRDGVEKIDDSWKLMPVTQSQQDFIKQLVKDIPHSKNSFEYQDYLQNPNRATASEFINDAIDSNAHIMQKKENYVGYIAKRPRAERHSGHGLFSDSNQPISLEAIAKEVGEHDGNVWTNIISLRREDAARLNFDRAESWRNLLRSHAETFADNFKIPLSDLRWYAAFHNESHHPHCHMIVYSVGKEPYLTKKGIENIKGSLARDIFKQDLIQVYKEQTQARNALAAESRDTVAEIIRQINSGGYDNPVVEELLLKHSERMKTHKGKKVYGYLDQSGRNLVNAIVDELAKDERITALYDLWYAQREAVLSTYTDAMPERIPLSQNNEFKTVKNAVITEALLIDNVELIMDNEQAQEALSELEAEDESVSNENYPLSTINSQLLYRRVKVLLDNEASEYNPQQAISLLVQSASQGYEWAQYRLGKIFLQGELAERDVDYGLKWLWETEAQNNQYAQILLGRTYLNGELVEQDIGIAEAMFEAAAKQGNAEAQYTLAKLHLESPSIAKAINLLEASAKGGNEWAQYTLGKMLMRGDVIPKDIIRAEKLLLAAIEPRPAYDGKGMKLGNQYAQDLLGKLYLSDDSIPKNAEKAIMFLSESAAQGNQWAQYQLGKMLLFGRDVEQDITRGLYLLNEASRQGNIYAEKVITNYYKYQGDYNSNMKIGAALGSMRLLGHLAEIMKKRIDEEERRDGNMVQIDRKLRRAIEEKKQALGLRNGNQPQMGRY